MTQRFYFDTSIFAGLYDIPNAQLAEISNAEDLTMQPDDITK